MTAARAETVTPLRSAELPPLEVIIAKPRRLRRPLVILALALAVIAGGLLYIRAGATSASTDNAYLKADMTLVAPRVRGHVLEVLVHDNQRVAAGDPLIRLDAQEYAARLDAARADLASADAAVTAAQAAIARSDAETRLAGSQVDEAATAIRSADAERVRAQADRVRIEALIDNGFVTRRSLDSARATAISAEAELALKSAELTSSRDRHDVSGRRRAEAVAALAAARAARARAAAALDLAQQDAGHVLIRAPIAGTVGDRRAQPGDYVQPGSRLLTLVPLDALYVVANFKETQVAKMLAGQRAEVEIDALPGKTLTGHVESFAPGAGSEFALLPFEPGTGNFTKIVQRVGVRIRLDPSPALARLRPGLSAEVKVIFDK